MVESYITYICGRTWLRKNPHEVADRCPQKFHEWSIIFCTYSVMLLLFYSISTSCMLLVIAFSIIDMTLWYRICVSEAEFFSRNELVWNGAWILANICRFCQKMIIFRQKTTNFSKASVYFAVLKSRPPWKFSTPHDKVDHPPPTREGLAGALYTFTKINRAQVTAVRRSSKQWRATLVTRPVQNHLIHTKATLPR